LKSKCASLLFEASYTTPGFRLSANIRRMASGRDGLSSCFDAHSSTAARSDRCKRTPISVPFSGALFFRMALVITRIDLGRQGVCSTEAALTRRGHGACIPSSSSGAVSIVQWPCRRTSGRPGPCWPQEFDQARILASILFVLKLRTVDMRGHRFHMTKSPLARSRAN
jgi:hypothetical protein